LQIIANYCKLLQIIANYCKLLWNFSNYCKLLQLIANYCKNPGKILTPFEWWIFLYWLKNWLDEGIHMILGLYSLTFFLDNLRMGQLNHKVSLWQAFPA
jgi:hypothetical protein